MTILSSTQLHSFRLSDLRVDYNDNWIWAEESARRGEAYDVAPDYEVFWSDEGDALVMLTVKCVASKEAKGACRFREVSATGWGILSFGDEVEEDERERRAYINGPAMLHGMLRGVINSATGSCVGGPFILPTVNYLEVFKRKAEQLSLSDLEEEEQAGIEDDATEAAGVNE
ncbi:MAG: hypothetical protein U9R79_13360 [Armatimonadota bacterium]|nr:hypothetical protein [Armatimonadota bacterium]